MATLNSDVFNAFSSSIKLSLYKCKEFMFYKLQYKGTILI